jgi:hypothetical protein
MCPLKLSSAKIFAVGSAVLTVAFTVSTIAQAPAPPATGTTAQQPGVNPPPPPRSFPAPTNLKVLPKDLSGQQVHEIMEGWEAALGAHCSTCHTPNPNDIGPNGRPRLDFADDKKPEKATARLMFGMVGDINKNYISKTDNSGVPVTCGTCHRGHLDPGPFVAPPEGHDHDHDHPASPPAAGEKPPIPR